MPSSLIFVSYGYKVEEEGNRIGMEVVEIRADVLSIEDMIVTQGFCSCWLGRRTRRWWIVFNRSGLSRVETLPLGAIMGEAKSRGWQRGSVQQKSRCRGLRGQQWEIGACETEMRKIPGSFGSAEVND
jgi:hypothetical protein